MPETQRLSHFFLIFLWFTSFVWIIPSFADPSYTAIDLGTLQGGDNNSWGWGINELGQVVGHSDAPNEMSIHAFLWENGEMTDLRTLGGTYSWAYGINNSSQITGYSGVNGLTIHGFFWEDGVMYDIGQLPGARGPFSRGNDINENGVIVGVSHSTRPGWIVPYTGFIYDRGNTYQTSPTDWIEIPTFGGDESHAYGVNDYGETVGYARYAPPEPTAPRAYLYTGGQLIDLGTFGGNTSWAEGVNNHGQVVGWSNDLDGNYRAFLWEGDELIDLGDFGGDQSWAYAINNLGQIVGKATLPDGEKHGFLLDNGMMWDLNEIVQPGLDVIFHGARGINDLGQIVTSGELPDESRHAYLLTPDLLELADPTPGRAGTINTFTIRNGTPAETVEFYWGATSMPSRTETCDLYANIDSPELLGRAVVDENGKAELEVKIPEGFAGRTLLIQAGERSTGTPSNLARFLFE
jgi:probable HAF family extracellular repeat protein